MTLHRHFRLNGQSFTNDSLLEVAKDFLKEGQTYQKAIGEFLKDWLDSSDKVIVYTSGSTGTPKEIPLKKEHMVNSALATGHFFQLKPKDTALLCLSADYIAGKMMLVRAMVLGLQLDVVAPSSSPLFGNTKSYDFCAMVPLQVQNSINVLGQIKTLLIGGASVLKVLREKLQIVTTACFETYGMTETITHIAVKKLNTQVKTNSHVTTNLFEVLPDITISSDERGCLILNAPKICDKTIVTNDLVKLVDKDCFEWLGRYDNVVNSGGVKLIPEQLEEKLLGLFKNRFFLAGVADQTLGEKLVIVFEGEQAPHIAKNAVESSGLLTKYEIPKTYYQVSNFIETKSGKINRKATLKKLLLI